MTLTAERSDARSWRDDELEPLFGGAFPAFITADQVAKKYIGRVREWFPSTSDPVERRHLSGLAVAGVAVG